MKCPVCGCCEDRVLDTRPIDEERSIRRRRECTNCLHRFTSYEIVESTPLVILKRDGSREEFNREKIMSGLKKACQKRPVTFQQMKDLVDRIEANLRNRQKGDVTTTEIYLAPEGHKFVRVSAAYTEADGGLTHMVDYFTCQAGYGVSVCLFHNGGEATEAQLLMCEEVADSLWITATE